jgi:hypothetical protein
MILSAAGARLRCWARTLLLVAEFVFIEALSRSCQRRPRSERRARRVTAPPASQIAAQTSEGLTVDGPRIRSTRSWVGAGQR